MCARVIKLDSTILRIDRAKFFNPASFVGNGWTIWKGPRHGGGIKGEECQDKRSLEIEEIDVSKIRFQHLVSGRELVEPIDTLRKTFETGPICLDAQVAQALLAEKGNLTLRWLTQQSSAWEGAGRLIYVFGTILRSPEGEPHVLRINHYYRWISKIDRLNKHTLWVDYGMVLGSNISSCASA